MAAPAAEESSKPVINKNARVIVRNLPFSTSSSDLQTLFSKYGKILDVHVPEKNGKPAGFAFVNFRSVNSVDMACRHLHETDYNGRTIQVSPALAKQFYDRKKNEVANDLAAVPSLEHATAENTAAPSEEAKSPFQTRQEPKKIRNKRKLLESDEHATTTNADDSSDNRLAEDNDEFHEQSRVNIKKPANMYVGSTLFVRNLPYSATDDDVRRAFERYGKLVFALVCKDRSTDSSRGTAFVRFSRCADMERALAADPAPVITGRTLQLNRAVARERLPEVVAAANSERDGAEKSKDKRNLYLMNVGTVMRDSEDIEGVSPGDMKRRDQLQERKKLALKNLHVFISPTRLAVHNLPKACDDNILRNILLDAISAEESNGVQLKECRVMRDLQRVDASGKPISKGFGFAEFSTHEHALKALLAVNNNPNIFSADRRPIVEFSLENRNALLKRQRRLEHSKLRLNSLNVIKVKQKLGLPLNTDDDAVVAGKVSDSKKPSSSRSEKGAKKQHVNRASNRKSSTLSSWNKPKTKKRKGGSRKQSGTNAE